MLFTLLVIKRLLRMPLGRAWEALRDDEIACRSLGLEPDCHQTDCLCDRCCICRFCLVVMRVRALLARNHLPSLVSYHSGDCGAGWYSSGRCCTGGGVELRAFNEYRMLMFGLLMVVMMLWRPQGLVPMTRHHVGYRLVGFNLSMRFGGLLAVNGVKLQLEKLVLIIGPNGAGKTTVFNCLTGFYKPTNGLIRFNGEEIQGLPGHEIARKVSCGHIPACASV